MSILLTHLTNCIFRTGIFPEGLKISRIIPIMKPGKPDNNLDSFRPINNLNTIEKLIEKVMKKQIDEFLEKKQIIPDEHHGSRAHHNTLSAEMAIDENLMEAKEKKTILLS